MPMCRDAEMHNGLHFANRLFAVQFYPRYL